MNEAFKYDLVKTIRDGKPIIKLRCPDCGQWGGLDEDQFNGRVSVQCDCGFHETIDFSKKINSDPFVI